MKRRLKKQDIPNPEIDGRYYYEDDNLGVGFWFAIIVLGLMIVLIVADVTGMTDAFINLWK